LKAVVNHTKHPEQEKLGESARKIRFSDSLFFRQLKFAIGAAFVIGLVLSLIQIATDIRRERAEINGTVHEVVAALKGPAAQAAYALNTELAERVLEGLLEYKPIYRAEIINDFNERLALVERPKTEDRYGLLTELLIGETVDYEIKLYVENTGKYIGKINVSIDGALVAQGFVERLALVFLSGVVRNVLLSLAFAVIFYLMLSRPLLQGIANLYQQPRDLARFEAPKQHQKNEIGLLFDAFNELLSDRDEANKALKESNEMFRSLTAAIPDSIFLIDQNGMLHGQFGSGHLGPQQTEQAGQPLRLSDWLDDSNIQMLLAFIRKAIDKNSAQFLEFSLEQNGQRNWFDGCGVPLAGKVDGTTVVLFVARDITERKESEKKVWQAKEEAEYANNVKTQFLANMSHELRTPLNAIIGFADIMRMEQFGKLGHEKYYEYSKDISQSGQHLLSVITEILDVSKIEAGRLELSDDVVDMAELIEKCFKLVEDRAVFSGVRLMSDLSGQLPLLKADELRLKQIMINLLSNSVKFTPSGGRVTVEAGIDNDGAITVKVSDTGIGIPREKLDTVLEPFGQVDDIMTRNKEGTGLGLFLAKAFSELHGACFHLDSAVEKGTVVTIAFPVSRSIRRDRFVPLKN